MSPDEPFQLPLDCQAEYYPDFLPPEDSAALFDWIAEESGVPDMRKVPLADGTVHEMDNGKLMFVDPELTDHDLFPATFGHRIAWPPIVVPLRDRIEKMIGMEFNVCVCIYYRDGEAGVGFHADLRAFGPTSMVPSISLGEKREFLIRRKQDDSDVYSIELDDGSLLIMGEGFQDDYEHSLPVNDKYRKPRINLTFRPFDWPPGFQRDSRAP